MGIKRQVLFAGYHLAKKTGYIQKKNESLKCANILYFHRINDYDSDPLTTSPKIFDDLMKIVSRDYNPISLQELIKGIREKKPFEPNTVVVTFDDGYRDNFLYAAPILKKYNIPATFFITSGFINTERIFPWDEEAGVKHLLMTWDEVRELTRMGFEIGAHTISHVDLGTAPIDVATKEIFGCKEKIESELGQEISTFAFPFGRRDCIRDETLEIVRKAGFDCCCSGYGGKVSMNSDLFNLKRVSMYPSVTEMLMEVDNFMTFYDGKMSINLFTSRAVVPRLVAGWGCVESFTNWLL